MKSILIDANIFLEFFLNQEKADTCEKVLASIEKGEREAVISSFAIDTIVLIMLHKKADKLAITKFLKSIATFKGLSIWTPTMQDRLKAIELMPTYGLDYEDALNLQTAITMGAEEILSLDKHFDKVKEVRRISP